MTFSRDKLNIKSFRNLLIVLSIFLVFLIIFNNYSPYFHILDDYIFILINFMVLSILFYVIKQSYKLGKKAFAGWTLITASIIVTLIGNIIWIMLPDGSNQISSIFANIFYFVYYPLILIGILYLPVNKTSDIRKYQILLDTGILIITAALILWIVLIEPIIQKNSIASSGMIIYLSYLLLDIFLLFTLIYLLFNWFGKVKKVSFTLLSVSAAILVLTNLIFIYQYLFGFYQSGGLLDAGWVISYILTALAGISYIKDDKFKSKYLKSFKFGIKPNWSSYLPLVWLIFIYIFLLGVYLYPNNSNLNIIIFGSLIMITMVFIRQIISVEEINRNKKLLEENKEILEKRERRLSLITDNMMDIVTMCNSKGVYEYISPSCSKILGYKPHELIGKRALEMVHPDDLQIIEESFMKARDDNIHNEIEYRHQTAAGEYIWIQTVGKPLFNEKIHQGFVCNSRNVDDRKCAEKQIKTSLEENRVLLKEIHHRVKNNMQIVSSLLSLQSRHIDDESVMDIFKDSQNRVKSMAMIHENIYQTENLARLNFDEYINKLVSGLLQSYRTDISLIKPEMDLCKVTLDADTAVPCGLILNELVTNSIKHAFNDKIQENMNFDKNQFRGIINVKLKEESENMLEMIVRDNGKGLPENFDFQNTSSLGLQLVNSLVNQIDGTIEVNNKNGAEFKISFKNNNQK